MKGKTGGVKVASAPKAKFKTGGAIGSVAAKAPKGKFKSGGMVAGSAPKMRADKRARGGRMTPSSPLSGATVTEKSFTKDTMPSKDEGGAGKDSDRGSRFAKGGAVKHWIAGAIKHPGAEKAAAKRAGMSTHAFMEKNKDAPGKAGQRARLGLRLSAMAKHKG